MPGAGDHAPEKSLLKPLTRRETEVLSLLAQDLSNAEIAGRLSMALSSIKWYARQIYAKLDVHSRREAAARARELGLDAEIRTVDHVRGGVRVATPDGRFVVENTLGSRIERVRPLLASEVAQLLWG